MKTRLLVQALGKDFMGAWQDEVRLHFV